MFCIDPVSGKYYVGLRSRYYGNRNAKLRQNTAVSRLALAAFPSAKQRGDKVVHLGGKQTCVGFLGPKPLIVGAYEAYHELIGVPEVIVPVFRSQRGESRCSLSSCIAYTAAEF